MKAIPGSKTQVLKRRSCGMPLMPRGKMCDGDVASQSHGEQERVMAESAASVPSCANLSTLLCCSGLSLCH